MHQNFEQKLIFGEGSDASAKRMAAVKLMLDHNIETLTIAGVVGVSERQVYTYKSKIKAGGDIYKDRHYKPVSDMDAMDAEIIKSLKERPVATVKEAVVRIEEITGIKRGKTQVRKFMCKNGLKPLKTASLPAKMDPAAQRKFHDEELQPRLARARGENEAEIIAFKKPEETEPAPVEPDSGKKAMDILPAVENSDGTGNAVHTETGAELKESDGAAPPSNQHVVEGESAIINMPTSQSSQPSNGSVVLFMDAVHCVWQAVLGVLWSVERILIPAASGRKRVNVLGAYDPVANKLLKIITRTYINSNTVCEMLAQIALAYAGKFVTVVLDNASYQHCALVINTAKDLGIELLFLPSYSPNLNLIERLWKFLKAKCLTNEFYNTSREFEDEITACLAKIETEYADEVKQLMSMKFHLYDTFDEHPTYYGKRKRFKDIA